MYKSLAVTQIFGERTAAGWQAAPKNPHGVLIALARRMARIEEETIQVEEVGAGFGQGNALNALGQPPHAGRIRSERQHFGQYRQSFLCQRGGGRSLA